MVKLLFILLLTPFISIGQANRGVGKGRITPIAVPGLIVWFDASKITGLVDADPVSTWTDESGKGYDITAATTLRPLYKTNILNGRPTVRFDGTDDVMGSVSTVVFSTGYTVFAVSKNRVRKNYNGIMRIDADATTNAKMEIYWNTENGANSGGMYQTVNREAATLTYKVKFDGGPAVDNFYIGTWNNTGSTLDNYINGTVQTVSGSGGTAYGITNDKIFVGIAYQTGGILDGDIAELIIYSSALSTAQRTLVLSYLNNKYGVY